MPTKRNKEAAPNDRSTKLAVPVDGQSTALSKDPINVRDLISTLSDIRQEVRSQQLLFFPTLALAITIPLYTIAANHHEVLHITPQIWGLQIKPAWIILTSWLVGVIVMAPGLIYLSTSPAPMTIVALEDTARFLSDHQEEDAFDSLNKAYNLEFHRLEQVKKARRLLYIAFVLFLLTVFLQFALVLLCDTYDALPTSGVLVK